MSTSTPPDGGNVEFWRDYHAAGLDSTLERRRLELKGKQELTEVVSLHVGPPPR